MRITTQSCIHKIKSASRIISTLSSYLALHPICLHYALSSAKHLSPKIPRAPHSAIHSSVPSHSEKATVAFRTKSSPPFGSGRNHRAFLPQSVHLQMEKLRPMLSDFPTIKEQVSKELTPSPDSDSNVCFPLHCISPHGSPCLSTVPVHQMFLNFQ